MFHLVTTTAQVKRWQASNIWSGQYGADAPYPIRWRWEDVERHGLGTRIDYVNPNPIAGRMIPLEHAGR